MKDSNKDLNYYYDVRQLLEELRLPQTDLFQEMTT